jgi:N-acetyl sugar amidotransferase
MNLHSPKYPTHRKPITFFVDSKDLRVCSKTVMDNTDPDITFDGNGVCNWWHGFHAIRAQEPDDAEREELLKRKLATIKEAGRGKPFDCIIGLSGGVDSSYIAYLAKKWDLRPLVVHFDNGWNDEMAVANIERTLKKLGFKLQTFVINWPQFRDLQRAYFKAGVVDLEVPTDHMIFAALHRISAEHGIRYILSGNNFATEWVLPSAWTYKKSDLMNIRGIHRVFGQLPMKELPRLGVWQRLYFQKVRMIETVEILHLVPYSKRMAKRILMEELDWLDYGGKHYESVFTRFYQGCILPERFGIDKRKAHLSNLICNGEMSRDEALLELAKPTYEVGRQEEDRRYIAKKLGWSDSEFRKILTIPPRHQEEFGSDMRQALLVNRLIQIISPVVRFRRKFLH